MTEMLKNMRVRYLIIGVILTLVLSLILCLLLPMSRIYATTIAGTLSLYAFPIAWILYHFRKSRISIREWLKPVRFKIRETIAAAFFPELLGMGILLLITVGIALIMPAGGPTEMTETTNWGLTILSAVILAPFCEELIFRGFVLNKMLLRFTPGQAVILSSMIFGALHLSLGLSPAIIGGVLCIITMKYSSIIPGIVIHFIHNLVVVGIKYSAATGGDTASSVITPEMMLPLILFSAILIAIGLFWLVLFIRKNWHYATAFVQQNYGDDDATPGFVGE